MAEIDIAAILSRLEDAQKINSQKIEDLEKENNTIKKANKQLEMLGLGMKKRLDETEERIKDQDQNIEQLEGKVTLAFIEANERWGTMPSSGAAVAAQPSEVILTGNYSMRWRIVFGLGAFLPTGFALASLKDGDVRWLAAARMFEIFGAVCSWGAVLGNARGFGSRNEMLFVGLCVALASVYKFVKAYLAYNDMVYWIVAVFWACIVLPSFFGATKVFSKLSDRKLGATITAIFKSFPTLLGSMLYISSSSLRCIMKSNPKSDLGNFEELIEECANPMEPTYWLSMFIGVSWVLTHIVPALIVGKKVLAWSDVMKLNMGVFEGFHFFVFFTFSIEALVLYALTDDEGSVMNEILEGLVVVAILNWFVLIVFTFIEYILKPHICRPSTRANLSSSVSSTDAFHFNPDTHISIHSI